MSFSESLLLEVIKALVAGVSAAVVGVSLFIIGQVVQRFVLDPVVELRKTVGEVGFAMTFYSDVMHNPYKVEPLELTEACKAIRRLASLLRSQSRVIPVYSWMARRGWVPCREQIHEVSKHLIGLSNPPPHVWREHFDLQNTRNSFRLIREALHLPSD